MTSATTSTHAGGPLQRSIAAVARRIGCTEGQVQTIALGLAIGILAAAVGLPPVFEDRPFDELLASPAAPAGAEEPPATGATTPGTGVDLAVSPPPLSEPALPPTGPDSSAPPTGEPPRSPGAEPPVPGANGACGMKTRSVDNPRSPDPDAPLAVWIYEPTGGAAATLTGGRCNDAARPAVFIAHGFGQSDPVGYAALIEHLVSVGNIVVYPTYDVSSGDRAALEASYRVVDAGYVAAVKRTPRLDTSAVGWWGHSHGGGMIPYLVQKGAARGWGGEGLWMSMVAQAYTQLVGTGDIAAPSHAQAISVAFQHDALADARLGIDVYESLLLPARQKRHVTILSGAEGGPFLAEHGAPEGVAGQSDEVDRLLWRYADLLQTCAMRQVGCTADLEVLPDAQGNDVRHAVRSTRPVDVGPYPAVLAECDAGFGPTLNTRMQRCGQTKI